MMMTIHGAIRKIENIEAAIRFLDDAAEDSCDEHKQDILTSASNLLIEYRDFIMNTKVEM